MSKRYDGAMTWAQIKEACDKMTPEQLATRVGWAGDDKGGWVQSLDILESDQVNPSGDAWESVSDTKARIAELRQANPDDEEAAELAKMLESEPIVARKGQPILMVDP